MFGFDTRENCRLAQSELVNFRIRNRNVNISVAGRRATIVCSGKSIYARIISAQAAAPANPGATPLPPGTTKTTVTTTITTSSGTTTRVTTTEVSATPAADATTTSAVEEIPAAPAPDIMTALLDSLDRPSTPQMSDKALTELTEAMESLTLKKSDLPERWADDEKDPGSNIKRFFANWPQYQKHFEAQGMSCYRAIQDASGSSRLEPRTWSRVHAGSESRLAENKVEFVTLNRVVTADQDDEPLPDQRVMQRIHGDVREAVAFYPPAPALDVQKGYRDVRPNLPRPVDVMTTDEPATDTDAYLDRGYEYVSRHWTKGKWKRGDLIGKNGSDPETKAQSASYAAPDCWDKLSERRVATSTGHMPHIERPPNVPLGWGGYDKFHHWQASGRQVTKDMVEEEDWSVDIDMPFDFVNEEGEVVDTVPPIVREQDLPPLADPPITLHELLNEREERKQKAPSRGVVRWAGT
ncbi:unnamed protein product, partial [Clonostachys rhizophaga]